MKRSSIGYGIGAVVWAALVTLVGWGSHAFLHLSTAQLGVVLASATAAPMFGIVMFDFKAFSRAAAEASNMLLARLGFRPSGVGSLSRPHGL